MLTHFCGRLLAMSESTGAEACAPGRWGRPMVASPMSATATTGASAAAPANPSFSSNKADDRESSSTRHDAGKAGGSDAEGRQIPPSADWRWRGQKTRQPSDRCRIRRAVWGETRSFWLVPRFHRSPSQSRKGHENLWQWQRRAPDHVSLV